MSDRLTPGQRVCIAAGKLLLTMLAWAALAWGVVLAVMLFRMD